MHAALIFTHPNRLCCFIYVFYPCGRTVYMSTRVLLILLPSRAEILVDNAHKDLWMRPKHVTVPPALQ